MSTAIRVRCTKQRGGSFTTNMSSSEKKLSVERVLWTLTATGLTFEFFCLNSFNFAYNCGLVISDVCHFQTLFVANTSSLDKIRPYQASRVILLT